MKLKREQEITEQRIEKSLYDLKKINEEVKEVTVPSFDEIIATPKRKRKRTVSVKRFKINPDGSKTLVATGVP